MNIHPYCRYNDEKTPDRYLANRSCEFLTLFIDENTYVFWSDKKIEKRRGINDIAGFGFNQFPVKTALAAIHEKYKGFPDLPG